MIKLLLKHFIYEYCIDRLFDGIRNNFSGVHRFNVGDIYSTVWVKARNGKTIKYYDAEVINIVGDKIIFVYSRSQVGDVLSTFYYERLEFVVVDVSNIFECNSYKFKKH